MVIKACFFNITNVLGNHYHARVPEYLSASTSCEMGKKQKNKNKNLRQEKKRVATGVNVRRWGVISSDYAKVTQLLHHMQIHKIYYKTIIFRTCVKLSCILATQIAGGKFTPQYDLFTWNHIEMVTC